MTTVPDFFQDESEEALRSQVEWQEQHLGLGDRFFARLLREDQRGFSSWGKETAALATDKADVLRDWWRTVLHLLSFQNFDVERVRALLERTAATGTQTRQSVFSPPWSASSLKEYVEEHGPDAIPEVDRWVASFTFGDPYAPPPKGRICL
jgi:phytoene dehydrogenase-like protein